MFTDAIMSTITDILNYFIISGASNDLTQSLSGFNYDIYSFALYINQNIAMPISYTILGLFFLLELYKVSLKAQNQNAGMNFFGDIVFRILFKIVLCKLTVEYSDKIIQAFYDLSLELTNNIKAYMSIPSTSMIIHEDTIKTSIESLGIGQQIFILMELYLIKMGVIIVLLMIGVIVIARFIEMYIYLAFAPIPLAAPVTIAVWPANRNSFITTTPFTSTGSTVS